MSTTIDNFTKQILDNLEAVEDRAKSLKESVQSATEKTQDTNWSTLTFIGSFALSMLFSSYLE